MYGRLTGGRVGGWGCEAGLSVTSLRKLRLSSVSVGLSSCVVGVAYMDVDVMSDMTDAMDG